MPLAVNTLERGVRRLRGVRRRHLPLRDLREHLWDEELVEDVADRSVREARIADVRRVLFGNRREDGVLAERLVLVGRRELVHRLEAAGDGVRPRGEVVELRLDEVV